MKIDRAKISREVQLGSKWIALEGSLDENESAIDGLAQLDKTIYDYLVRNGVPYEKLTNGEPAKVINRAHQRAEDQIAASETIEELATYKEYATKNPDLMPFYMNKLKELTEKIS